jgi:hypothetical protein
VAGRVRVHVFYHGPFGLLTACVLCSGSLCQLSLLCQPPSRQGWLCYHEYTYRSHWTIKGLWVRGRIPTLGHQVDQ